MARRRAGTPRERRDTTLDSTSGHHIADLLLASAQTRWERGGKRRYPELSVGEILERVAQTRATLCAVSRYLCSVCFCFVSVCVLFVCPFFHVCVGARVHGWEHGVYLSGV
jgi:hypothetical protein